MAYPNFEEKTFEGGKNAKFVNVSPFESFLLYGSSYICCMVNITHVAIPLVTDWSVIYTVCNHGGLWPQDIQGKNIRNNRLKMLDTILTGYFNPSWCDIFATLLECLYSGYVPGITYHIYVVIPFLTTIMNVVTVHYIIKRLPSCWLTAWSMFRVQLVDT